MNPHFYGVWLLLSTRESDYCTHTHPMQTCSEGKVSVKMTEIINMNIMQTFKKSYWYEYVEICM